jgi:hypothetical protein
VCPWCSMLSISPFELFISFCCIFFKFDHVTLLEISFLHFHNVSLLQTHNSLSSQTCYSYRVENCTEHQVGMYVLAGVGGVATVLPVVGHCVKSHYFLDQPCIVICFPQFSTWADQTI